MTNALTIREQNAMIAEKQTATELAAAIMTFHPGYGAIKKKLGEGAAKTAMLQMAQLSLMIGASPLPYTNEMHPFENRGQVTIQLGINYYRRRAREYAGGVLFQIEPRPMKSDEITDYDIDGKVQRGAICRGIRFDEYVKLKGLGLSTNEIYAMAARTGIAVVDRKEYSWNGRSLVQKAMKRSEVDLYRQLIPELNISVNPGAVQSAGLQWDEHPESAAQIAPADVIDITPEPHPGSANGHIKVTPEVQAEAVEALYPATQPAQNVDAAAAALAAVDEPILADVRNALVQTGMWKNDYHAWNRVKKHPAVLEHYGDKPKAGQRIKPDSASAIFQWAVSEKLAAGEPSDEPF